MTVDRPVAFPGTDEEKLENYKTHFFATYGDERECVDCCCKPWHTAADYPCGTEPPRETVEV